MRSKIRHCERIRAVAYVNTLLAAELKLLAMMLLYWIASRTLTMTPGLLVTHSIPIFGINPSMIVVSPTINSNINMQTKS